MTKLDYVKSIPIPQNLEGDIEELVDDYDGDVDTFMKELYDNGDANLLLKLNDKKT